MFSIPLRVHEGFKARHPNHLQRALLAALLVHLVLFLFAPPITFKPYALAEPEAVTLVETVPRIEIPELPPKLPPPRDFVFSGQDDPQAEDPIDQWPTDLTNPIDTRPQTTEGGFTAFDELPKIVEYVAPKYPPLALEAGIEGTVNVKVVIGPDGKVLAVSVLSSDVTSAMEKSALEAARRSTFRPARQRHVPVKAWVAIPYRFRLR